jgi:hypothetical protein
MPWLHIFILSSWATFSLAVNHAWAKHPVSEQVPVESMAEVLNRHELASEVSVDFTGYQPTSGVAIRRDEKLLRVSWPMAGREQGVLILQLRPDQPLIEELGISKAGNEAGTPLIRNINPVTFLTVGTRDLSKQGWNVFFDNPPLRPHTTYRAVLSKEKVRIESQGRHSSIIIDGISAGPFRGDLRFTVYPGCRLIHVEAVLSTEKDACAILYDAGLTSPKPDWKSVAWMDTDDQLQRVQTNSQPSAVPLAARHRTIIAENDGGCVALFPRPHQFLYPLDFADNFKLVWHGRGFHGALRSWTAS